ncbi:MAG: hypothetical protein FGM27_04755 [Candidatus Omnitrophica bacterium]|nr:hypothetical protein [Candidatus Omnitrophota bacterium]
MKKLSKSVSFFTALMLTAWPLHAAPETADFPDSPKAGEAQSILSLHQAEIRDALRLIATEYDLSIVMNDEVTGAVTLRLKNASLVNTLDALLVSRGLDYDIRDNIIRVASAKDIAEERKQRNSRQEREGLITEVLTLHYLDAIDMKPTLESMLSSRGKISVLEQRPHKGFAFGSAGGSSSSAKGTSSSSSGSGSTPSLFGALGAAAGAAAGGGGGEGSDSGGLLKSRSSEESARSKTLLLTDLRSQVERIKEVVRKLDVPPRQVLIDAKILEVNSATLEDIGLDLESSFFRGKNSPLNNSFAGDLNSGSSNTAISPDILSNVFPADTDSGIHAVFTKVEGEDLTVIVHALLQDKRTKTLSSPKILTVENQEAAILVGEQFPIFQSNVSDQGTVTESLSYYQPIGISLQVIAQVTPKDEVILIIHPTVSAVGAFVTGTSGLTQPRITTREADTRVLMKNGETLVIGGLLEDEDQNRYWRIPFLDRLPLIGKAFTRRQDNSDQRNLLIFITPRIIDAESASLTDSEKSTLEGIRQGEAAAALTTNQAVL